MSAPADEGLQPERTALAWRRTALAVVVGSLVGLRVLPALLGPLAYVVCVAGLLWSVDLGCTAVSRYRQADAHVRTGRLGRGPGAAVGRTAAMTATIGLAALAAVIVMA